MNGVDFLVLDVVIILMLSGMNGILVFVEGIVVVIFIFGLVVGVDGVVDFFGYGILNMFEIKVVMFLIGNMDVKFFNWIDGVDMDDNSVDFMFFVIIIL